MDPNATLEAIYQALDNSDLEEAEYLKGELDAWINKGGFTPDGYLAMRDELNATRAGLSDASYG